METNYYKFYDAASTSAQRQNLLRSQRATIDHEISAAKQELGRGATTLDKIENDLDQLMDVQDKKR